jgi:hypothetical protein
MIPATEINFREEPSVPEFIQQLIYNWYWKFVLHCNSIESMEINTESPSHIFLTHQQNW